MTATAARAAGAEPGLRGLVLSTELRAVRAYRGRLGEDAARQALPAGRKATALVGAQEATPESPGRRRGRHRGDEPRQVLADPARTAPARHEDPLDVEQDQPLAVAKHVVPVQVAVAEPL